jgi:SAM-dependent methyltransferase
MKNSYRCLAIFATGPTLKEYEPVVHDSNKEDQEITVFISYAREDSKEARRLYEELRDAGLNPWLDEEFLKSGENWKITIDNAIKKSIFFFPILSSRSVEKRGYVQQEFRYALDLATEFPPSQIFIIPVRLDDCEIPYEKLKYIKYVDLFPNWNKGLQKIAQDLNQKYPQISRGKYRRPYTALIEIMMDQLDTDNGIELDDSKKLNVLYKSCFDNSDIYCGTDTNIPSRLIGNLQPLFEEHEEQQIRNNNKETSRILIVNDDDIAYDYQVNYSKFVECYRRHKNHNVSLYQVDRHTAEQCANDNKLPADVIEVGIWVGKYAIQLKPSRGKSRRFSFGFAEDGQSRYSNSLDYFDSLRKSSRRIDVVEDQETKKLILVPTTDTSHPQKAYEWKKPIKTDLDDETLVRIWKEFVNCEKRIRKTGEFLSYHLEHRTKILDAAAGVGCETVYLALQGKKYEVTANEGSKPLLELAQQYARRRLRKNIRWTSYDWRVMAFEFYSREFDAVLVLGNFISLIHEEEDRRRCLDQFYKILKPGGILIIDQRNYEKIFKNRDKIDANPDFYKNNYSGGNLYRGEDVKGWPYKIHDNKLVTFRYAKNTSFAQHAEISLYMFEGDELKNLLVDTGFTNIKGYSDYELHSEFSENAEFFTYVAEKFKGQDPLI